MRKLKIYNFTGQEIKTLISGYLQAGEHEIQWVVVGFASGMYFCKLMVADHSTNTGQKVLEIIKLILQK